MLQKKSLGIFEGKIFIGALYFAATPAPPPGSASVERDIKRP